MPGFITHLCFGEQSLSFIEDKGIQNNIEIHRPLFSLGLQGPDIFFYHIPAYIFYKKNIGNVMHRENVMCFFDALLDARNSFEDDIDRDICDSYILGFIGHYTLDTWCHPYVYFKSDYFNNLKIGGKYDFGRHVSLETDIDHLVLEYYHHCKPSDFDYAAAVRPSNDEIMVISKLLFLSINNVFPEYKVSFNTIKGAIKSFINLNHAMHDPNGNKKRRLQNFEHLLFKYDFISSMIPSDTILKYDDPCNNEHSSWTNPWNELATSNDSVFDLIHKATPVYLERIKAYQLCIDSNLDEDVINDTNQYLHYRNDFLSKISDLSYLSGLPL